MPLAPKEREALTFLAKHLVCGLAAGAIFGIGVLVSDLSHIRTLALDSAHPVLVLVLMFFGLFITFGSVAMVAGIMSLGRSGENGDHGG